MRQERSSEAFVVGQAFRAQTGEVYRVPGEGGTAGLVPGVGVTVPGGPEDLGSHQTRDPS